jgi:hypothetical protein
VLLGEGVGVGVRPAGVGRSLEVPAYADGL